MKINYFFPIFVEDDSKEYFEKFFKTEFFKKHKNYKIILCVANNDVKNAENVKKRCEQNKNIKALIFDKEFLYNDAFDKACEHFDGDVILLGDLKISKIDFVFEKCLEKKEKGANIVHVVKRKKGFKSFIFGLFSSMYNFFVKLFINKRDRLNEVSLGLVDGDIVKLLKELPKKRCFLKNTKDLIGFDTRTVYIDDKTEVYKQNYKKNTSSLIVAKTSGIVGLLSFVILILSLVFSFAGSWLKITMFMFVLVGVILFSMFLPKHIFETRNYKSKNIEFKIKEIN